MKLIRLIPLAALLVSACDKSSSEAAKKLAEMERKTNEAISRQQELEQQLENQRLTAERDAIERERMQLEDARAKLEQQQSDNAAAETEKINAREKAIAARESALETRQSAIDEKADQLQQREPQLNERERKLAGTAALSSANDSWDETPVNDYGMFHDSLSSYGSWFETPNYGYVWQPAAVRNTSWRPYTNGRWACSDYGWTWVSEEPYGWATYHYGRWALVRGVGWVWVPGCEWAPSWVSWRSSGSHIGWAPLPPETLAYRWHSWNSTVDVACGIGAAWFCFVEIRNFGHSIRGHCLPYEQNHRFYQETQNITNIYVTNHRVICGGPQYDQLSRQIGKPLPFYRLEMNRQGQVGHNNLAMQSQIHGDRLQVFAPSIDTPWNDSLKPKVIRNRIDTVQLERPSDPNPEIAERFRNSREENRSKAEQTVAQLGGREAFIQHRNEQLEKNRTEVDQRMRQTTGNREVHNQTPQVKPLDSTHPRIEQSGSTTQVPHIAPEVGAPHRETTHNPDPLNHIPQPPAEQGRNGADPLPTDQIRHSREQADLQQRLEESRRKEALQEQAQRDLTRQQATTDAQREQARLQQEQAQRQADLTRQKQVDDAQREQARQKQMADAQREQARLQQEVQRQADLTRQKQVNDAQREQARLQQKQIEDTQREQARQQADAQRQREQARQQQEQAQREQARQQQEQAQREQARQQQEQAQREQARQQQEQAQREQARQQQEAQRQQARQQQEQAQREQARQQQQQQLEAQREQARQLKQQQDAQRQQNDDSTRKR